MQTSALCVFSQSDNEAREIVTDEVSETLVNIKSQLAANRFAFNALCGFEITDDRRFEIFSAVVRSIYSFTSSCVLPPARDKWCQRKHTS